MPRSRPSRCWLRTPIRVVGSEHSETDLLPLPVASSREFVEERFCGFQVGRGEAFGKAIVDGLKQRKRLNGIGPDRVASEQRTDGPVPEQ